MIVYTVGWNFELSLSLSVSFFVLSLSFHFNLPQRFRAPKSAPSEVAALIPVHRQHGNGLHRRVEGGVRSFGICTVSASDVQKCLKYAMLLRQVTVYGACFCALLSVNLLQ